MKTKTFINLAALFILLPMISSTLRAQKIPLLRVNVPFEFIAGSDHLPPGHYRLSREATGVVMLWREDGPETTFLNVMPPSESSAQTSNLVFNRYGETYFLAHINATTLRQAYECYKSSRERELAAQYRASGGITVALNAQ
jgi:hypothetical protein